MEMMEEDEPLSSSEAQRVPAQDTEEVLSIPVAGPETPFRPTSGMSGLTTTGEHVTALQFADSARRTRPESDSASPNRIQISEI